MVSDHLHAEECVETDGRSAGRQNSLLLIKTEVKTLVTGLITGLEAACLITC